ncbi:MAG: HEAT repeat domain-containing protein [Bacteroidota bacterium]|nr:HEAT repeat domain-containing protein [uncultured Allomuricauda sp.]
MEKDRIDALLPEYLDNTISEKDRIALEAHLAQSEDARKALKEMKLLFEAFKKEDIRVPSNRLRLQFEEVLQNEKNKNAAVVPLRAGKKESSWASNVLKIAASIALLVTSFQIGSVFQQKKTDGDIASLENETLRMKQTVMLSLMENQSASKRIQGVNYIEEIPNPDDAVVAALANRMLYDENDNVRLTAFEALSRFTSSDKVKEVLIQALGQEKNPSIQIAIIQVLVQIQEKKAVGPMQRLLEQEDTQPFIKEQIKTGLPKII